jgi:hypothetical protein
MSKKISKCLASMLLVLSAVLLLTAAPAWAAQPDLIITGTGLYEDVVIYPGDWGQYAYAVDERYYSSNNALDFHHIWKVWGYDLFSIIGIRNLKSQKYAITFYSRDGAKMEMTIGDLRSRFYYPRFDVSKGKPIAPMIGFKRVDLYEYQDKDGNPPDPVDVIFEDKPVGDDSKAPRLYFGQSKDKVSDRNMTFFLYKLAKIVVGDERPSAKDETAKKGGGGAEKSEATKGSGTTKSGKAGEKKADGKSEMENEEGAAAPKDKDDRGDKKNKEDADGAEIAAPETGDGKNPGISGTAAGGETRRRWPWIAAGAVVAAGLAGGGVYYYINKRRISK